MQEGRNIEHKLSFDPSSDKDKVELVKLIIAFANSGGGDIVFGKNEHKTVGVDQATVDILDSAKCTDYVARYCDVQLHLSHHSELIETGRFLFTLRVPASQSLIVMSREGSWSGFDPKKDRPLFLRGDVWVRHSSKTERIANQDIRDWADRIRNEERERIISVISAVSNMPPGSKVELVSSGRAIESPKDLLTNACLLRRRNKAHLLNANDLLWIFLSRQTMTFDLEEMSVLVASALRRNPTLYWWISQLEDDSGIIIKEVQDAILGSDRDKSDAARSVIELASIYADEETLRDILTALRRSRYSHFRMAARQWQSRREMKAELVRKIAKARDGKIQLTNQDVSGLELMATAKARQLYDSKPTAATSTLARINRVIWYKRKGHLLN